MTILVIDDEASVRSVLQRHLSEAGYRVLQAETAAEAVVQARGEDVDLIISDVMLPGMPGTSAVGALEEMLPDSKILFMSGFVPPVANYPFLAKPFSRDQLLSKVRELLGRS